MFKECRARISVPPDFPFTPTTWLLIFLLRCSAWITSPALLEFTGHGQIRQELIIASALWPLQLVALDSG